MLPLSVRVFSPFFLVILLVSFCIRTKMFQKSPSIRRQLDSDSMSRLQLRCKVQLSSKRSHLDNFSALFWFTAKTSSSGTLSQGLDCGYRVLEISLGTAARTKIPPSTKVCGERKYLPLSQSREVRPYTLTLRGMGYYNSSKRHQYTKEKQWPLLSKGSRMWGRNRKFVQVSHTGNLLVQSHVDVNCVQLKHTGELEYNRLFGGQHCWVPHTNPYPNKLRMLWLRTLSYPQVTQGMEKF